MGKTNETPQGATLDTPNGAGRSIWPVGLLWSLTIAAVVSMAWQAPAIGSEKLKLQDFNNIEQVAISPIAPTTPQAEMRPKQRSDRALAVVDHLETYRFWSDNQLASMYEGYWFEAQSVTTPAEVDALADRMSDLWQVLGERDLQTKVRAPDLESVAWFLHETAVPADRN